MGFYEDLGVSKEQVDRDAGCIKTAYKRRALELHPDKQGGNEESFKSVARAYRILCDDNLRTIVDCFHPIDVDPDEIKNELEQVFPGMDMKTACRIFQLLMPHPSTTVDMTEKKFLVEWENRSSQHMVWPKLVWGIVLSLLIIIHIVYFWGCFRFFCWDSRRF